MKCVLIGAGSRGMLYAQWAYEHGVEITAVAEPRPERLQWAGEVLQIPSERLFSTAEELFAGEALGDTAIIASLDRAHFSHAMQAMDRGYDILLEKPISPSAWECVEVERRALELGRKVTVCHVLRYHALIAAIRAILDSGELGRVVNIKHTENVGNWHMAHSFVRGNWHSSAETVPIILAKACHDMDLLVWLAGSGCESVASFGDLTYFREENAPAGSARRCCDCPLKDSCRFSAYRCYLPVAGDWPAAVLTEDQSEEGLREAIRTGPYGRCVYRCDNNVCDHQVSILRFDNGVTATFNLSGFTDRMTRTIKIMGEDGEIRASEAENEIEIIRFASTGREAGEREVIRPEVAQSGHSGGDSGIVEDFLAMLEGRLGTSATDIRESVESHMMACAAEEARLTGTVVRIADFRRRHEREQQA